MLANITVILVRTRFPENIGMVARAMANMGVSELILVQPERWEIAKALPLATPQAEAILASAKVEETLVEALKPFGLALAVTARTGGWRGSAYTPEQGAQKARECSRCGDRVALVFGPEDRGLVNEDVALCPGLITIPTAVEKSSLNLAQAALIVLYECVKADLALPFSPGAERQWTRPARQSTSRKATVGEENILFTTLQETLQHIGHLPEENPEWFMQPMRRFLRKHRLLRHEFDMIMGICRQIQQRNKEQKE